MNEQIYINSIRDYGTHRASGQWEDARISALDALRSRPYDISPEGFDLLADLEQKYQTAAEKAKEPVRADHRVRLMRFAEWFWWGPGGRAPKEEKS